MTSSLLRSDPLCRYDGDTHRRREISGDVGRPHISADVWLLEDGRFSKGPEVYAGEVKALVGGRGWGESRARLRDLHASNFPARRWMGVWRLMAEGKDDWIWSGAVIE